MATFFEEMAELVVELLGPGSDFGEQLVIERPRPSYNAETRSVGTTAPQLITVWGTLDPSGTLQGDLATVTGGGGLAARYERVLYAVPAAGVPAPGEGDRVQAEGITWQVMAISHVVKQGVPLIWTCGLEST